MLQTNYKGNFMKRFRKIYLEISNICNLHCRFCPGTKRVPKALTDTEFETLLPKLHVTADTKDVAEALGGKFSDVSQSMREKLEIRGGVQVTSIERDGLLGRSGIKEGFVITYINDRPVTSLKDLERLSDNIESIESIDGIYPNGRALRYVIVQ